MDMGMGDAAPGPLNASGVDFSNYTQRLDFLGEILDDSVLQVIGNRYATYFWYGVVVVIGLAALYNAARWVDLRARLRAAAKKADGNTYGGFALETLVTFARGVTYRQFTPILTQKWLRVPPLGNILLIGIHFFFVMILEFVDTIPGAQYWQALGVRAGWLAIAQMPLIILLVGKNNLIGLATGVSYERLNVFHRWTARIMFLLAMFHFGFQSRGWTNYGLQSLEWSTDSCPITGIAAFSLLIWINLSNLYPLRRWCYELWVAQHILLFMGFIVAIVLHLPTTALYTRVYIYIPIVLYLLDRVVRTTWVVIKNRRRHMATVTPLPGGVTKIRVPATTMIKRWTPGAHMLMSLPRFGVLQTHHPATIMSTPQSHGGDLIFLLRSKRGFTKQIYEQASSSQTALLSPSKLEALSESRGESTECWAILDGPYGAPTAPKGYAAYESICLIAGGSGVSYTLALLLDLADRATNKEVSIATRTVHFVWCIKSSASASWVSEEITTAEQKLRDAGLAIKVTVYTTCQPGLNGDATAERRADCKCKNTSGPCCCSPSPIAQAEPEKSEPTRVADDEITPTPTGSAAASLDARKDVEGTSVPALPCADFHSGRPVLLEIVADTLKGAESECAVVVCGPLELSSGVRNAVAKLETVTSGGCYLHVEDYC